MKEGFNIYGIFAGIAGFMGMVFGAMAAHKAQDAYSAALLGQASFYALIHSLALLHICRRPGHIITLACILFTFGMILFCGGLALKGFSAEFAFVSPIIPFGGGCLMMGWLTLTLAELTRKNTDE
jgi:uncharacterized membrane protein YgdD (TMEM256/DUF423 family)